MWRKIFSGKKQAEGANIELEKTAREDTLEEASAAKAGFF